jgi:transposase
MLLTRLTLVSQDHFDPNCDTVIELTLEDPHRFHKSRDVGCYLGLQPGRGNSGQRQPQMHISKEGDPYLRTPKAISPPIESLVKRR